MEEEIIIIEDDDIEEINIEEENYSGKPYELPIASADVLGGIKVGENLTIDADGTLNATGGGTGDVDLTEYAKKSELPTKVSELTNDSGFISEIPSEYVTETDYATREKAGLIRANINTNTDVWQDYLYGVVNSYEQYQEKDRTAFVSKGTLDNVLEAKDYLTEHQDISGKQDKLVSGENIKTINGNSLLGEGNIVIEGGSGGSSNVVVSPTEPLTGEDVWFQKSVNLFNKNEINSSSRITSQGTIGKDDANANVTDFIKVIPNEQYTIQGITLTSSRWYNYYYDINQEPISGFETREGTYTITIPENAYYMRFTISNNDINKFQFEKGSIASDYQEWKEDKLYTKTNAGYEEFSIGGNVEQNIFTAWNDESLRISANSTYESFVLAEYSRLGDGFSIENGSIKVGKGISKILVSYVIILSGAGAIGNKFIRIQKNTETRNYMMVKKYVNYLDEADILASPTLMLDVNEGDTLTLQAYGTVDDYYYSGQSYITLQKIA